MAPNKLIFARRVLPGCVMAAVAMLTVLGCGKSKGNVKGIVYYKDKPLPSGLVTFMANNRNEGTGTIQPDGSYSIKNVPAGDVTIVVTSGPSAGGKPGVSIPQEYSDPAKTKEKYTVVSGNQERDIKLK